MDLLKRVLILGAGSGIGSALLKHLSKEPNRFVIGLSRRGEDAEGEFISGKNYRADLTDPSSSVLLESLPPFDAIYCTLGSGLFKPFPEISREELDLHLQTNLTAPFFALQKLYPGLKKANDPFVCILSSTAGKVGFPQSTAYCISKHAIAGMAKALREEWKPDKIRLFLVYPGAISTEIWADRPDFDRKDMIAPEAFARYLASFLDLDPMINIEDSYVLPPGGIL